jgi:hypothetical protein
MDKDDEEDAAGDDMEVDKGKGKEEDKADSDRLCSVRLRVRL